MFENKIIKGEYATRYIASWSNVNGVISTAKDRVRFAEWLESIGLSDEEIYHVVNLATCGKLELEASARRFVSKNK